MTTIQMIDAAFGTLLTFAVFGYVWRVWEKGSDFWWVLVLGAGFAVSAKLNELAGDEEWITWMQVSCAAIYFVTAYSINRNGPSEALKFAWFDYREARRAAKEAKAIRAAQDELSKKFEEFRIDGK